MWPRVIACLNFSSLFLQCSLNFLAVHLSLKDLLPLSISPVGIVTCQNIFHLLPVVYWFSVNWTKRIV